MSDELLQEIEELAGCFFSSDEILEICELQESNALIETAIRRGRLRSEAEMRKSIFDLAKAGSSPAQAMAVKFMDKIKREEY